MYFFFFLPVGTETGPGRRPVGTALALGAMFTLFGLRLLRPDAYGELVLASFRPSDPHLAAAVLSLFLHGGWTHLLGNALYLALFGRQLESRLGFLPLAVLFLVGGTLSCWVQAWLTPEDSWSWNAPLIGASGSVAALLGASLVRFHHRRVRILWFLFAFLGGLTKAGVVRLNMVVACLAWFALQLVEASVAWGQGGGSVAYAAHAGGFLAGIVLAFMLGLHRGSRREIHLDRGRRHFEKSDWYAAAGELTTHLQVVPEDVAARRMRARCLVLLGSGGEAAAEYLQLFRDARRRRDVRAAASLYGEMRRYGIGANLPERALLRLAYDFHKAGRPAEAVEVYDEIVSRFPAGEVTDLATIRAAELLWSELGRYEDARGWYRRLLESGSESEWRDVAEARWKSMNALTGPIGSPARGTATARARPSARRASSS